MRRPTDVGPVRRAGPPPIDPAVLAGPAALAVAASLAVVALWRAHQKADERDAATIRTLTDAVGAFPAALKDLTAVVKAAAEREADRKPPEQRSERQ